MHSSLKRVKCTPRADIDGSPRLEGAAAECHDQKYKTAVAGAEAAKQQRKEGQLQSQMATTHDTGSVQMPHDDDRVSLRSAPPPNLAIHMDAAPARALTRKDKNRFLAMACLDQFSSVGDAMCYVKEQDPYLYLTSSRTIERRLCQHFQARMRAQEVDRSLIFTRPHFDFAQPSVAERTQVIIGPTGIGKTEFALSHFKRPLSVSDKQDLLQLTTGDDIDGFVLDNVDFSQPRRWNTQLMLQLFDVKHEQFIKVKYGVAIIPRMMPRIVILHQLSQLFPARLDQSLKEKILLQCTVTELSSRLFESSEPESRPMFHRELKKLDSNINENHLP